MNIALPEMLQRLNVPQNIIGDGGGIELSVMERQQARIKWQNEQQQQQQQSFSYMNGNDQMCMFSLPAQAQQFQGLLQSDQCLGDLLSQAMKQDPDVENRWDVFGNISEEGNCVGHMSRGSGFDMNYTIPRTISCPLAVAAAMAEAAVATGEGKDTTTPEKLGSAVGRDSFKKRKVDKSQNQKVSTEEETKDKKMKGCAQEGDSKITQQHSNNSNGESSADASREHSKLSEVKKPDFIHVRARRGQATDSHSLAERVRREKISERMKFLQDLVPGCNKVVGKAGMLDEIINYVQSLQKQVEFLSMKLAAVNPTIDFNIDSLFSKEMFQAGLSSEMANLAHLQFNPLPQIVSCSEMESSISPPDMALRRTISAPVSIPETFLDQSCCNHIQHSSTWDADLQNLYAMEFEQGKSSSFYSQTLAGYIEAGHVKLEM